MSETAENLQAPSNPPALVKYEAARQALAECSRVDECKEWSDKAAALAAYAKQAKDSTLHNLALRIQQRAQRRMGELLKQIPSARGENLPNVDREGAHPTGKARVASDAGLSEHQRKTALRIASVPESDFEGAVESDQPPTVTEMAMRGTMTRMVPDPAPGVAAADPAAVARAHRGLREFAAFCATHDPVAIAHGSGDADLLRGQVDTISHWLDRFVVNLPNDEEAVA